MYTLKEVKTKRTNDKLGCFVILIFTDGQNSFIFPAVSDTFKDAYRFAWSQARHTYRVRHCGWRYTS